MDRGILAGRRGRRGMDRTDHGHGDGNGAGRVTSPMQEYTAGQAGVGAAVLVVGLAVTFGLGLVLALALP